MTIPTEFTLEELAHFDRCLFPEDLERGLREAGLPEHDIPYFVTMFRAKDGTARHFMSLYQEYISDPAFIAALTRMVGMHVAKMRQHQPPARASGPRR